MDVVRQFLAEQTVAIAGAFIAAAVVWAVGEWREAVKKRDDDRTVDGIVVGAVNEVYETKVREWKLNQREGLTVGQRAEARMSARAIAEAAISRAGIDPVSGAVLYGRIAKVVKDAKKG